MAVIEIRNLTKTYFLRDRLLQAVSGVSLEISSGAVFGFLGPNGAGKTTTMKMLVGLAFPDAGSIRMFGADPKSLAVRQRIGFMPETPAFYTHLTAREFMEFAADLFELERGNARVRTQELLGIVELAKFQDMPIRKYSKGMMQRLGLAQALINNPDILFLDEPLDGLDPLGRADVKKLLLDMKHAGKTIFFNSHILSDVEDICDRVGIIDRGHLIREGAVADVVRGFNSLEEAFVAIVREARAKE